MPDDGVIMEPLVERLAPAQPAPGAEEQKPQDGPAPAADDKEADRPAATDENAKPDEQRHQSRRERKLQRERDARIAAETELRLLKEQREREQSAKQQDPGEPNREKEPWASMPYEQFLREQARYDAKQELSKEFKTRDEQASSKDAAAKRAQEQKAIEQSWQKREAAFVEKTPDYEKVVGEYVEDDLGQLSDEARRLIVDSDVGPALLHHLATNSEAHERIAKLNPVRQAVELAKLEEALAKPAEAKTSSDAPAPAKPNPQGKSSAVKDPDKMTQAEYMAWRAKQGARWAR